MITIGEIGRYILLGWLAFFSCRQHSGERPVLLLSAPELFMRGEVPSFTGSMKNSSSPLIFTTPAHIPETFNMQTAETARKSLRQLFHQYIEKDMIDSNSRRFIFFEFDLNGDGEKEIIVGLNGTHWGEDNHSSIIILNNDGTTPAELHRIVGPVYILNKEVNQWKELIIKSDGSYYLLKPEGNGYSSRPESYTRIEQPTPGDLMISIDFDNGNLPQFSF